jgi:parallel beta-helix repeat protein
MVRNRSIPRALVASASVIVAALVIELTAQVPVPLRILTADVPSPPIVGPRRDIVCPLVAINISPGTDIQRVVDAHADHTIFCLKAGVHAITSAITPKTGDAFIGEFGAILDGSRWTTPVPDHYAAFMAHNQDIDDVTIGNLVIRNMPQRCVHAFYQHSDRWIIENNEITGCRSGVSLANASVLRHNYIHHNSGDSNGGLVPNGGYIGTLITNSVIADNEIAYNGPIQKVTQTTNVTFRNNYVHHNGTGIWFDGDNVAALIEDNLVEDNATQGIFYEISGQGVIRNNVIRRSGESGIFVSTSHDVEIYRNTLEHNFRAVNLFVSCGNVHPPGKPYAGATGWDLRNNDVHDNTVVVGNRSGVIGNLLGYDATCTAAQADAYLNGSKHNAFRDNRYVIPSVNGAWWHWGAMKTWNAWKALGQDRMGSISQ